MLQPNDLKGFFHEARDGLCLADDKAYFADQVSANKIIDLLVETAVETDEEPEAPKAE